MNYLGLDYGESHVGVAIATGPLAQPLTTLDTKKALLSIKQLVEMQSINAVVIGNSSPEFLFGLKSMGVPVHQVDETLSSVDAVEMLKHTTQSKRKSLEHSAAAAVILQSFLDSHT